MPAKPAFEEVSAEVGLVYRHFNGMSGKLYTPEVMGPGVALLDYDNDGDLDVYLGQGNMLDEAPPQDLVFAPPGPLPLTHRFFRNDLTVRHRRQDDAPLHRRHRGERIDRDRLQHGGRDR